MLQGLRTASNTWAGRILLALVMGFIIISFAIWGIGNIFQGFGQNHLASVGRTEITVTAYRNAYQSELDRIRRQTGQSITNDQARAAGIDRQVLAELLSQAAMDQQARSMGLAISDKQIAQSILDDPSFKGPSGAFDRTVFNNTIRDQGYSEQGFVAEQRQVYLRRQIEEAIAGDLTVPRAALEAVNRFRNETRSIDYVVLPATAAGEIGPPSDDELKTYFADRRQAYRTPELRKLVVLSVTPALLAKPDAVSDADAQQLYDQVKAQRYETPEKRDVQQIVFPTEAEAQAASSRLKSGESFDALVQERKLGVADIELGTKTKAEFADQAIADAAFAVPQSGVSEPVKGAFGTALLRVTSIVPGGTKPFAEVAAALKTEIATQRARADVAPLHDKIEELRTAGKTLGEAAKSVGLEPRTLEAVDAAGNDAAGKSVADLPEPAGLLKAAFASDIGVDNDTIETRDGGYVWFEVQKIDPAHDRTLEEARPEVEKAWRADETSKRLAAKAADLVKKIDGGDSLQSIAAETGAELRAGTAVRRSGAPGLPPGLVAQVFDATVGAAGSAAGDPGTRILFKVTGSTVPPLDAQDQQSKAFADQYAKWLTGDVVGQYVAKVQADLGSSVNPQALSLAVGSGETD